MEHASNVGQAVELLQELGLKEYEAKCFVALARLPKGTAKEISEISEVPRTRIYDAVRVLESKGLVEVQHSNPQLFRAVSVDEAVTTLRTEYESRTESLRETLRSVEPASADETSDATHEVWALSGTEGIANRTRQLLDEAHREIFFVVGDESAVTDSLVAKLTAAQERGVTVVVGTVSESLRERVEEALPEAEVFVSGLEWLNGSVTDDETRITRLLLVDRTTIMVSTAHGPRRNGPGTEKAVFGRGFENGIVTITRRLLATGLLPVEDPGKAAAEFDPE